MTQEEQATQEQLILAGKRRWRQRISSKISAVVSNRAKQRLIAMYPDDYKQLRAQIRQGIATRAVNSGTFHYPQDDYLIKLGRQQLHIEARLKARAAYKHRQKVS